MLPSFQKLHRRRQKEGQCTFVLYHHCWTVQRVLSNIHCIILQYSGVQLYCTTVRVRRCCLSRVNQEVGWRNRCSRGGLPMYCTVWSLNQGHSSISLHNYAPMWELIGNAMAFYGLLYFVCNLGFFELRLNYSLVELHLPRLLSNHVMLLRGCL